MSILTDALARGYAAQDAAGAQRRIEWTPEANRVALKRLSKRERILARLRQGPAGTWDLMQIGGSGFNQRIQELRIELRGRGGDIVCAEHRDGAIYTLVEP